MGLHLEIRLLLNLAALEPLLESSQDVFAFHIVHRKGAWTAKYVSLWSNLSKSFLGMRITVWVRTFFGFASRRNRPRRSTHVARSPAFLFPNIPSRCGPLNLYKPRGY